MPSKSLLKSLGLVIRKRRLESGIAQEPLANSTGLHPTNIGLIERGRRNPNLHVCARLTATSDITLEILFGNSAKAVQPSKR